MIQEDKQNLIYDEEINALSWTIIYLKSKIGLFNKKNAEIVKYLEQLLSKISNS